jgi:hypothetical protein
MGASVDTYTHGEESMPRKHGKMLSCSVKENDDDFWIAHQCLEKPCRELSLAFSRPTPAGADKRAPAAATVRSQ